MTSQTKRTGTHTWQTVEATEVAARQNGADETSDVLTVIEFGERVLRKDWSPSVNETLERVFRWTGLEAAKIGGFNPFGGLIIGFPDTESLFERDPNIAQINAYALKAVALSHGYNLSLTAHGHGRSTQYLFADEPHNAGIDAKAAFVFNHNSNLTEYYKAFNDALAFRFGLDFFDSVGHPCGAELGLTNGEVRRFDAIKQSFVDAVVVVKMTLDFNYYTVRRFALNYVEPQE